MRVSDALGRRCHTYGRHLSAGAQIDAGIADAGRAVVQAGRGPADEEPDGGRSPLPPSSSSLHSVEKTPAKSLSAWRSPSASACALMPSTPCAALSPCSPIAASTISKFFACSSGDVGEVTMPESCARVWREAQTV